MRSWPSRCTEVGALLEGRAMHGGRSGVPPSAMAGPEQPDPARRGSSEVLGMVGLQDAAKRRVGGFSLGMTQRLGIAAALLGDPPVLLLDEPVNGLDPEGIIWIRHLMKEPGGAGPDRLRLQPLHGRDGADRGASDRDRARPAAGRHHRAETGRRRARWRRPSCG